MILLCALGGGAALMGCLLAPHRGWGDPRCLPRVFLGTGFMVLGLAMAFGVGGALVPLTLGFMEGALVAQWAGIGRESLQ